MKMFRLALALLCASTTVFVAAHEHGAPVFEDSFDVAAIFAENWDTDGAKIEGGRAIVPNGAWMRPRSALPPEFIVEADIVIPVLADGKRVPPPQSAWCGLIIDGYHFQVQPCGKGFAVWRLPNNERSSGRYDQIPSFMLGKPVHFRVVRRRMTGSMRALTYVFTIDDVLCAEFIAPEPKDGTRIELSGYKCEFAVDNFLVSFVGHEDDSPNMVYNSGFEHGVDGIPLYYGLHGDFDFLHRPAGEYETRFLRRFAMDGSERHSGSFSLRVEVNDASRSIVIAPWQTGTVKGLAGVFSAWMKSSVDDLPVEIALSQKGTDGHRIVHVGREWRRYEVTCSALAGKGVYSPVRISPLEPAKRDAVLWIDDLQCEIVDMPRGGTFDLSKTYATPYRPSELDKSRFGGNLPSASTASYAVRRLADGVRPTVELDGWKDCATEIASFWNVDRHPTRETRAYVACDADRLYIGFRNFGEDARSLVRVKEPRDSMIYRFDGIELFFKPTECGSTYHFMGGANGDMFDMCANDIKWDGSWQVEACGNAAVGSIDYLVTIPFSDFVQRGLSQVWRVNLCRNDWSSGHEPVSTARTRRVGFDQEEYWCLLEFPSEVAAEWEIRGGGAPAATTEDVVGRLNYYMDESEVAWRVRCADGRTRVLRKPMSDIPMGTNVVSFTVCGKRYSDTVVRLPFRREATQINRWTRSVVHNGRNELFTGLCLGVVGWFDDKKGEGYPGIMSFLREKGFRHCLALIPSWSRCAEEACAFMSAVDSSGMLYLNWCDFGRKFGGGDIRDDMTTESMVELFRPFEGCILSNMVLDEPELYMESNAAMAWLESMKARYPYLPVQMNNTVMGIPSRFAELKTDILMLDDYLTNNEGRTVESVVRKVDEMTAVNGGKPCWFFLVCDNMTLHYKNPSYDEQIAQSWGSICAGCTGIAWYMGFPRTEGSWRAMVDVNREAQLLSPVILSEELCGESDCDRPRSILRHMTRTLNGDWYVFSCNIDANQIEKASFALPEGAPRDGVVEVLFENRTLPLRGGAFSDFFPSHSRHLYKVTPK